jgi:integrase
MPAPLKGNATPLRGGGFASRPQIGKGRGARRMFTLAGVTAKAEADARDLEIKAAVRALRRSKHAGKAEHVAEWLADAATPEALSDAREAYRDMVGAVALVSVAAETQKERTVRQQGEAWTTGELARAYPAAIRAKATATDDAYRLEKHVYPFIGDKALSEVTMEDRDAILRADTLRERSRRQVDQVLRRVFALAVDPCPILKVSPFASVKLPRKASRKAKSALFPSEVTAILASTGPKFDLARRVLLGFCVTEGGRKGEPESLEWRHLDLRPGVDWIELDVNKTDDPRGWPLDPGTAEGLRRYHRLLGKPAGDTLVFRDVRDWGHLSNHVRAALARVGVTREELTTHNEHRIRLRFHDATRATFITTALACGKSEAWVTERTGHKSSAQVYEYRRRPTKSATAATWFASMAESIPELAALGESATETPNDDPPSSGHRTVNGAEPLAEAVGAEGGIAREPESGASANSATFASGEKGTLVRDSAAPQALSKDPRKRRAPENEPREND